MTTETNYWQRLRPLLVPRVFAWKINAAFANGVPDCWLSGMDQDLWMENKRIYNDSAIPAMLDLTDEDKYLTALQQEWLVQRHKEGRHVGVLVFSKEGHVFFEGLTWQEPISKLAFVSRAKSNKEMAKYLIDMLGERGCLE